MTYSKAIAWSLKFHKRVSCNETIHPIFFQKKIFLIFELNVILMQRPDVLKKVY
jgi:hypothetical protein